MPAPEITPAELAPRLGSVTLIDVRQPAEYGSGCIATARLMPLADVPDHLDELKGLEIVVVCRSGSRSAVAAEFLVENGISAHNLAGGIVAWFEAGHEVVTGDQPA